MQYKDQENRDPPFVEYKHRDQDPPIAQYKHRAKKNLNPPILQYRPFMQSFLPQYLHLISMLWCLQKILFIW